MQINNRAEMLEAAHAIYNYFGGVKAADKIFTLEEENLAISVIDMFGDRPAEEEGEDYIDMNYGSFTPTVDEADAELYSLTSEMDDLCEESYEAFGEDADEVIDGMLVLAQNIAELRTVVRQIAYVLSK